MIIDGFDFSDAPKRQQYLITVSSPSKHIIEERLSDFMTLKEISDLIKSLSRLQHKNEIIYLRISEVNRLTGKWFKGGLEHATENR